MQIENVEINLKNGQTFNAAVFNDEFSYVKNENEIKQLLRANRQTTIRKEDAETFTLLETNTIQSWKMI